MSPAKLFLSCSVPPGKTFAGGAAERVCIPSFSGTADASAEAGHYAWHQGRARSDVTKRTSKGQSAAKGKEKRTRAWGGRPELVRQ